MYGAPFGKNYTLCEPCFLSLNKLKKHGSQNEYGEFFQTAPICVLQSLGSISTLITVWFFDANLPLNRTVN